MFFGPFYSSCRLIFKYFHDTLVKLSKTMPLLFERFINLLRWNSIDAKGCLRRRRKGGISGCGGGAEHAHSVCALFRNSVSVRHNFPLSLWCAHIQRPRESQKAKYVCSDVCGRVKLGELERDGRTRERKALCSLCVHAYSHAPQYLSQNAHTHRESGWVEKQCVHADKLCAAQARLRLLALCFQELYFHWKFLFDYIISQERIL